MTSPRKDAPRPDSAHIPATAVAPRPGAIVGAIGSSSAPGSRPVYPEGPHCNILGLSDAWRAADHGMIDRGMIFDPDHMSVAGAHVGPGSGRGAAPTPGVVSSHVVQRTLTRGSTASAASSRPTPAARPALCRTGHHPAGRRPLLLRLRLGADMNGFGAQGDPRGADAPEPGALPVHGVRWRHDRPAAQRRAGLRRQRRRGRALRPLPRLDRGPAHVSRRRHRPDMARGRGLPTDVGAARGAWPPTRAATPACGPP